MYVISHAVTYSVLFQSRIEQMANDVALFLKGLDYGEAEVGMVEFHSSAQELVPIIPLDSDENLNRLLSEIPTRTTGSTSIGSGLLKAIEVFHCDIILFTTVFGNLHYFHRILSYMFRIG